MTDTNLEAGRVMGWRGWWGRRSRVGRWTVWLLGGLTLALVAESAGVAEALDTVVIVLSGMVLVPLLLVLGYRWFFQRFLWKVRNRLILTYLLMGLAPVVLVATLAGLTEYLLAGQYATDTALSLLDGAIESIQDQAGSAAVFGFGPAQSQVQSQAQTAGIGAAGVGAAGVGAAGVGAAGVGAAGVGAAGVGAVGAGRTPGKGAARGDGSPLGLMELRRNAWVPLSGESAVEGPLTSGPPPSWLHVPFQGIVEEEGKLYLCSEVSAPRNGQQVVVLGSRALTAEELSVLANGFGRITLTQGYTKLGIDAKTQRELDKEAEELDEGKVDAGKTDAGKAADQGDKGRRHAFHTVRGGVLAARRHFWDPPVVFSMPMTVTSWDTGQAISSMMVVESRPTLLYAHLFATSSGSGLVVRWVLIGLTMVFGLLVLVALLMAASLSWTITRSVEELYKGTREIDAGHLEHRITVKRRDQLAALAGSFNRMAASVSELLEQQREKERLLNELAIAQEVQATLFPESPASVKGFEVHGVCVPARTIGGDYFDFIFRTGGSGGLTLALGDISGKGISAALLMSSLHSADRAFSVGFGVEEGMTPSPAKLLKLLNGHLYRSTQSARYATLFLASYDAGTRRLTYANGGHLPPLVISKDGTVRRLDCGGTVVGLMEGMEYEEATVQLEEGDLLVAFTDGLTEPERAGEDFGEKRLLEFVREHREEPLTVLAEKTLQVVREWIGEQEQPDDMTIVMARSCADGGSGRGSGGLGMGGALSR